ncbi:MAG: hypothetical protein DYG89_34235 [Caldilinea sp. CFX5]|nr:hypothetical protein [Caldilinea sp. CFX5]
MFTSSQIFTTFQQRSRVLAGGWSLVMAPGLFLTLMALAILVWPELLAYLVAGVLLFAGITLIGWSLALRQAERRATSSTQVQYRIY